MTNATGILSVNPASGEAGTMASLTINLDPNATNPTVPGIGQTINTVVLGGVLGTNVSRPSRYVTQATFVLPATPNLYDLEIVFSGPQARTFGLQDAFEVTSPTP